jgi:hypothetical protein
VAAELSDERFTVKPPVGAATSMETVPVASVPLVTEPGEIDAEVTDGVCRVIEVVAVPL